MKFLVILICLVINYAWLKDFDRFDDGWFFRFRARMAAMTAGLTNAAAWLLALLLIYGIPMLVLAFILIAINGRAYDMPLMLMHILVLLIAFDRIQPGNSAKEFLAHWRAEDDESALLHLRDKMELQESASLENAEEIADYFARQLIYWCFERMFVMFFWYIVAGPLAVLFSYISYQLRDCKNADTTAEEASFVVRVIMVLEWVPLRLLAVTFSLAGNFVRCFESLKSSFWESGDQERNAEILYSYSTCALTGIVQTTGESSPGYREQRAKEIEALLALLERSQAIWLIVLAIITVTITMLGQPV